MVVRRTRNKAAEADVVKADVTPAKKPKVEEPKVVESEQKEPETEQNGKTTEPVVQKKPIHFNWISLNTRIGQVTNGKFKAVLGFAHEIPDGMGNVRLSFIIGNKVWSETTGSKYKKPKMDQLAQKIIEHYQIEDYESLSEQDYLKISSGPSSTGILAMFRANKHCFNVVKKVVREADEENKVSEVCAYSVSLTVDGKSFVSETKASCNVFMEKEVLAVEYLSGDDVRSELNMFLVDQQNKSFRESTNGAVESSHIIDGAAYSIDSLIATIGLPKIEDPFIILSEYSKETKNRHLFESHDYQNLKEGECCIKLGLKDGKVIYGTSFTKKAAKKVAGLAMLYLLQQEDVLDEDFNLIIEEEEEESVEEEIKSPTKEPKKPNEPKPKSESEQADIKLTLQFNSLCVILKQEATFETTEQSTGDAKKTKIYSTTCTFKNLSAVGTSNNKKTAKRESVKALVGKFEAAEKMSLDTYLINLKDNLKRSKEAEVKKEDVKEVVLNGNRKRKAN